MKCNFWIRVIGMLMTSLLLASCNAEEADVNGDMLVGSWLPTEERYFVDGQEIILEEGHSLFIYKTKDAGISAYNDKYLKTTDFGLVYMTFHGAGKMDFCGFPATYRVKDGEVVCTIMGDDTTLVIDGDILVESKESVIYGYVISAGFWPEEDTVEKHLDGVSRKFKVSTHYAKED